MAFQSAIRQIKINYLLKAYVAPILTKETSTDSMAYENIIPTFS